jgi:hypothetical protein
VWVEETRQRGGLRLTGPFRTAGKRLGVALSALATIIGNDLADRRQNFFDRGLEGLI